MSITDPHAGAHEGEVLRALLARLLAAALDEEGSLGLYHAVVERFPATAILCAYETAKNQPAALIRRSRGAYFVFLLKSLRPDIAFGQSEQSRPLSHWSSLRDVASAR